MFFSSELLTRRDSGFGLLWLAATLGSKSTFKKLPRRSVLTADISQLCGLIAQPEEPLALRLSSNLMVGVVRVYKVKQEMFMNDVSNCVTSLKKVVQEFQTAAAMDMVLQMPQPTTRPSAVTIAADPKTTFMMDFDALVADWDEFLNVTDTEPSSRVQNSVEEQEDDPAYSLNKQKTRATNMPPLTEEVRAEMVTLKENHDHLFSNSLDLSFHGNGGLDISSSQPEPMLDLLGNLFIGSDGFGLDLGLGDELVKELGEGWGSPSKENQPAAMDLNLGVVPEPAVDIGFGVDADFMLGGDDFATTRIEGDDVLSNTHVSTRPQAPTPLKRKKPSGKENCPPNSPFNVTAQPRMSPGAAFSLQFLSEEDQPIHEPTPLADTTSKHEDQTKPIARKSQKRTRLLLDARTELTDDELQIARAQYIIEQTNQRRVLENKRLEKESGKIVEDLIWGVPIGIEAPALMDFWQENFKVQVEARTGLLHLHIPGQKLDAFQAHLSHRLTLPEERPLKRRRVHKIQSLEKGAEDTNEQTVGFNLEPRDYDNDVGMGPGLGEGDQNYDNVDYEGSRLRSSEEPGQGRQMSKPPSVGGKFSLEFGSQDQHAGSQRSSLFPWDNAAGGPSSSVGAFGPGSDRISVDRAEIRLRGNSFSRRESSLVPSQTGSVTGIRGISPGDFGKGSQILGEDFVFGEVGEAPENTQLESQRSDINLVTLERNSFNFLEYAKMQHQAMPNGTGSISFDTVVPKLTSTRHVASTAFYHCLVLATKDLLRVQQRAPYETISISVI